MLDPDTIALEVLRQEILRQTGARGPDRSICPSEVARAMVDGEMPWQPLMDPVRKAALRLQAEGRLEILRKGRPVPADAVRGVIRLRIAAPKPEAP